VRRARAYSSFINIKGMRGSVAYGRAVWRVAIDGSMKAA